MSEEMKETRPEVTAKLEDSNLRKRKLLQDVASIAEDALANQPEGTRECWLHFNKAVHDIRKLMRPKPGTLAFTEERYWYDTNERGTEAASPRYQGAGLGPVDPAAGSGAFITPKAVIADPALQAVVEPQGKPISPDAPEMVRGGNPWHPLEIPECGIDFKRYYSADCEVYICAWKSKAENISHVYEVRCRKLEDGQWRAVLSNDGRKLCSLSATGKHLAYMLTLGAMRQYLRRGHRKTIRRAEARGDARPPVTNPPCHED